MNQLLLEQLWKDMPSTCMVYTCRAVFALCSFQSFSRRVAAPRSVRVSPFIVCDGIIETARGGTRRTETCLFFVILYRLSAFILSFMAVYSCSFIATIVSAPPLPPTCFRRYIVQTNSPVARNSLQAISVMAGHHVSEKVKGGEGLSAHLAVKPDLFLGILRTLLDVSVVADLPLQLFSVVQVSTLARTRCRWVTMWKACR